MQGITATGDSSNVQNENTDETLDIPLPELPAGSEYLVSFFNSAGIAMSNGYGLVALPWQELKAWVECTNVDITMWELEIVRKMSEAYASEAGRASDPKRKAPYTKPIEDIEEIDREAVAAKVISVLSGFKKKT